MELLRRGMGTSAPGEREVLGTRLKETEQAVDDLVRVKDKVAQLLQHP